MASAGQDAQASVSQATPIAVSPMALQPPVPGLSSLYNNSKPDYPFSNSQGFQSGMNVSPAAITMPLSSAPNVRPITPSFNMMHGTPGTAHSVQIPFNPNARPAQVNSYSIPLRPFAQPQAGAPYSGMSANPHGVWLQSPQMEGILKSPYQPHPTASRSPFPSPAPFVPSPSVFVPNAQQLDTWTAHKTETGVMYYHNAVTGESTYDKPAGFKEEPDKVSMQPVPISTVNLSGTDWVLVTTSDGKKFYHNSKTKVSSWQIPNEVIEMRKKQDDDMKKEHPVSVPNTSQMVEKESTPISLSAPAISTGGRESLAYKASTMQDSTSALDLVKKKLQDYGAHVTSSPVSGASELNCLRGVESTPKVQQSENSKDKQHDTNGDANMSESSSDSEDADSGPRKEEGITQFKEMLKERGVAPFSKWEKELPKIVFDPRFKAIPSYSRRSLFEHYVKTRAEEERKEKRAAQKAAIEAFKQLLDEAAEDIDEATDYYSFRKKWANDPRFDKLDRKDREYLLNERILPLKKAAEEKAEAARASAATSFKCMLQEKVDITVNSRWSRVKDSLRNDPRYKSVKHEDREVLFNKYISDLKAVDGDADRVAKTKRDEQDKLRERERELRKRKEREEQETEKVRLKVRRKEAVSSFQALLMETIKDPQASWTESKPKLEKDSQRRATNPDLSSSDMEKLFRDHMKMLNERCTRDFKDLLAEVLTTEAASQEKEDGKTALNSWSTAKDLLRSDPRYNKMPRIDREVVWHRYTEEMLHKQKSSADPREDRKSDAKSRSSADAKRATSGSRGAHDRR